MGTTENMYRHSVLSSYPNFCAISVLKHGFFFQQCTSSNRACGDEALDKTRAVDAAQAYSSTQALKHSSAADARAGVGAEYLLLAARIRSWRLSLSHG